MRGHHQTWTFKATENPVPDYSWLGVCSRRSRPSGPRLRKSQFWRSCPVVSAERPLFLLGTSSDYLGRARGGLQAPREHLPQRSSGKHGGIARHPEGRKKNAYSRRSAPTSAMPPRIKIARRARVEGPASPRRTDQRTRPQRKPAPMKAAQPNPKTSSRSILFSYGAPRRLDLKPASRPAANG